MIVAYPAEIWVWVGGLVLIVIGVGGVVAIVVERMRFRSERAEPAPQLSRSAGGDPVAEPLEPAFRATDEVFVDPTSGRRMRVWHDPSTGERRYRPEG
jgi:hypothetical protein